MLVKMKERIAGIEAGRIVTVSELRGIVWVERGYAEYANPEDAPKKEVKADPVIEKQPEKEVKPPHTGQSGKGKKRV
jgi:hypothetical protein